VRRYVRGEIGLPREQVSLVAYWRHRDPPDDPADPADPADEDETATATGAADR
jgi:hypothetical protein